MRPSLAIRELRLTPLAIPMRLTFEHASASRDVADPIVLRLSAAAPFAECEGYGETLARPYVTGESVASVLSDINEYFVPRLANLRATSFAEVLEFLEDLPFVNNERLLHAARTAVELAVLDLAGRAFNRRLTDVVGWLGIPGFGLPGAWPTVRYSGYVVGAQPRKLRWVLKAQRLFGLRDFKIKVATPGWEDRLAETHRVLRAALAADRVTLRADANAGWSLAEAHDGMEICAAHGVGVLEQPLPEAHDPDLAWLAEQSSCALMVDESLLSYTDGESLIAGGGVQLFNIRIAKHGGLLPALRLAGLALGNGLDVQLGCLVGQTSILTAAELAFLQVCPRVRFVEGALGTWLLRSDIASRGLRFGYRGRLRVPSGPGNGISVDSALIERFADSGPLIRRF